MPRHPDLSVAASDMPASIFARLVERLAEHKGEVFPFHLGDTYLPPPVRLEELDWGAAGNLYAYSPPAGDARLIEAVAHKLAARNGMRARPSEIQIKIGRASCRERV